MSRHSLGERTPTAKSITLLLGFSRSHDSCTVLKRLCLNYLIISLESKSIAVDCVNTFNRKVMFRHYFGKILPFKRITFLCRAFRRNDRRSGFDYRRTNHFTINYKCKRMVIATIFNIYSCEYNVMSRHGEIHSFPFGKCITFFNRRFGKLDFGSEVKCLSLPNFTINH